jgi:hypothetical protein
MAIPHFDDFWIVREDGLEVNVSDGPKQETSPWHPMKCEISGCEDMSQRLMWVRANGVKRTVFVCWKHFSLDGAGQLTKSDMRAATKAK